MRYKEQPQGSIVGGALWMLFLSLLLFWLPIAGPLIAGFVGGRVAGTAGNGFIAAILPAIVLAIVVFIVASIFNLPFIGLFAGFTLFVIAVVHSVWVIIGGVIGGALA